SARGAIIQTGPIGVRRPCIYDVIVIAISPGFSAWLSEQRPSVAAQWGRQGRCFRLRRSAEPPALGLSCTLDRDQSLPARPAAESSGSRTLVTARIGPSLRPAAAESL